MGGAEHTVPTQARVTMLGAPPSTPATLTMTSGTGSSTFAGLRWIFIALLLARLAGAYPTSRMTTLGVPPARAWTAPGSPPATCPRPLPAVAVGRCRSGMIPPWENPRPSPASRASSRHPTWPTRGAPTATWPSSASPTTRPRPPRPGARYGPRAMRDASTNWAYRDGADALLRRRGRRASCWAACASSTPATSTCRRRRSPSAATR